MERWFDVHASRVGPPEQRLVALSFSEITEQRLAEDERRRTAEALRESEQRFRLFADTAPAMLWVTDADGHCSYLSRGWYRVHRADRRPRGSATGGSTRCIPTTGSAPDAAFVAANQRRGAVRTRTPAAPRRRGVPLGDRRRAAATARRRTLRRLRRLGHRHPRPQGGRRPAGARRELRQGRPVVLRPAVRRAGVEHAGQGTLRPARRRSRHDRHVLRADASGRP